jgi:predicted nucleic acid-binding protein
LGVASLKAFLRRHRVVALDTSIFIYQLEAHPRYVSLTDHLFSWIEQPANRAVTSTVTMTELLVQPCRVGSRQRVDEFYGLLSSYPNLDWVPPGLKTADTAARIRTTHCLKTPDALQAATAIQAAASGLITNDPIFRRVQGFETLVLDQFL